MLAGVHSMLCRCKAIITEWNVLHYSSIMPTAYTNCRVIEPECISAKTVVVEDGRIIALSDEIPSDAHCIDLQGQYLSPGFIDLQINGAGGALFGNDPTSNALQTMTTYVARGGTTSFLATIPTNTTDVIQRGIEAAIAYRKQNSSFLGLHLEGPFINTIKRGAHVAAYVQEAILDNVSAVLQNASGIVKMITLAPEACDLSVLNFIKSYNMVISAGHSNATFDEVVAAMPEPISAATHLFNAMPSLHHREVGLLGAVFDKKPYASIIADGIHVHYAMVRLAKQVLTEKLFLITDAVTSCNSGPYQHIFNGDRYILPDGTLSGSALTMIQAVRNCVEHCNISLLEAVRMATLYPARVINASDRIGAIQVGMEANFVVFRDDFSVTKTIVRNICIFDSEK